MGLVCWTIAVNTLKYFMLLGVKLWEEYVFLPCSSHCNTLPVISNTDYVELDLEIRCVKSIWSCLNRSNVVVRNVSLFLLSNKNDRNNFRYFTYKNKVYRNNWFSKLMTLMKCIYVDSSDSTLRYGHFISDLCSIRGYSSIYILTSTEFSFLIEYICTI